MAGDNDILTINAGGISYQMSSTTLHRFPNTRLNRLVEAARLHAEPNVFVDRSPRYFEVVLELYRTGDVHLSPGLCWYRIRQELEYWELEVNLAPCCLQTVLKLEAKEELARYLERQLDECCMPHLIPHTCCGPHIEDTFRWRCVACVHKIWAFLEDPTSSLAAKIWGTLFLVVVMLSVFIQVAMSHPVFREELEHPIWNITGVTNPKVIMFASSTINPSLWTLEMFCFAVFLSELTIRFFVCPDKFVFLKSPYNLLDLVCLTPMLLLAVLESSKTSADRQQLFYVAYILSALGSFRILRVFKFLRHFMCVRVLILALRASLREIALLVTMLLLGMLLFANLIYFAELYVEDQFESIPIGFWWAVVTMTTVGYGDKHPRSGWGYVIGALCATCGMLLIGIPIPAVANNFNALYAMARQKRLKMSQLRSDKVDRSACCGNCSLAFTEEKSQSNIYNTTSQHTQVSSATETS